MPAKGEAASAATARAMDYGRAIRTVRADMKKAIKAGDVDAVALWRGDNAKWEPAFVGMKAGEALLMIPGIGEMQTDELLRRFALQRYHRVRGLSFGMRGEMADLLHMALTGMPPES